MKLHPEQPIGLFDSGIGGLTVYKRVRQQLPNERLIYLGDLARLPYGNRSRETITSYAKKCAHFLQEREIKLLVIACNTVSSVAYDRLRSDLPCPVVGMIEPAAQAAVRSTRNGRIGVIGTRATIGSESYRKAILALNPKMEVFTAACPLFVPLVEEGITNGPMVTLALDRYLPLLKEQGVDTVILGCTHYPLLEQPIREFFGGNVTIIDCGVVAADEVGRILKERAILAPSLSAGLSSSTLGHDSFFVTDSAEQFERMARSFLDASGMNAIGVEI
jgi:glutamate racemase